MIQIKLGPVPRILAENSVKWGEEYANALQNRNKNLPERYRSGEIRDALRDETFRKCAYCESKFEHVSFSHIEHIIPKSREPLLVCTWSNITLACTVCNTKKGAYYEEDASLLNPYVDDIDSEIDYYGPMAIHQSARAKLTIVRLQLNRPELLHKRHEKLQEILGIFELITTAGIEEALKNALLEDLKNRISSEAEYAGCVRVFVAHAPSVHSQHVLLLLDTYRNLN